MRKTKKAGVKLPICTILILTLLGGVIYWGYAKFDAEQTIARKTASAPVQEAASGASLPPVTYRSAFPLYFLVGFAIAMALIMGSIVYFWWSLKDMEGGRRYGEEEETPTRDSDKVSAP